MPELPVPTVSVATQSPPDKKPITCLSGFFSYRPHPDNEAQCFPYACIKGLVRNAAFSLSVFTFTAVGLILVGCSGGSSAMIIAGLVLIALCAAAAVTGIVVEVTECGIDLTNSCCL